MSDQKLRELERKWKETGSVEDEAAYLRERVRVGDLTQERLELAAYCGAEAAQAVMSTQLPVTPDPPDTFLKRLQEDWGPWWLLAIGLLAQVVARRASSKYPAVLSCAEMLFELASRLIHCDAPEAGEFDKLKVKRQQLLEAALCELDGDAAALEYLLGLSSAAGSSSDVTAVNNVVEVLLFLIAGCSVMARTLRAEGFLETHPQIDFALATTTTSAEDVAFVRAQLARRALSNV